MNFDVVIDTPDASVDMKSGLNTLQGVSDAARCIAETLLTGRVPERQSHKSDVRTTLKQSFRGSYGQVFSIDIYEVEARNKFRKIGRSVFCELLSYFLKESVYREHTRDLSEKAASVVDGMGDIAETLTAQLRMQAMRKLHDISEKFGYNVKIRYRLNRDNQTELASFDRSTAETLQAEEAGSDVQITAAITRLNINTGNGRLCVEDTDHTVAFGFRNHYARIPLKTKKLISENLAYNNLRGQDEWIYMEIKGTPILLPDGRVVKYLIRELLL